MPHRVSPNGSYRIDRRFKGVGRIALASGTKSRSVFVKLNAMLTELHEDGHLDILRGIRDRRFTLQQVYQAKRNGGLSYVASELLLQDNIWRSVDEWLPISAPKHSSRKRYEVSFRSLRRSGPLGPSALIADLREVDWGKLQREWPAGPADWNRMRAAVSSFVSWRLGDKFHPFRRALAQSIPLAKEPPGRVPDLSPELIWRIVHIAPEHVRAAYVTLAVTGMRVGEYMQLQSHDLLPHTLALRVPGTKTASSQDVIRVGERAWPWIKAAVPAPLGRRWLYNHWKRACRKAGAPELTLHDLRHFYGQQLIDAGRPEVSVQYGLRHTDAGMTRRYIRQRDRGENALAMDDIMFPTDEEQIEKEARKQG
jgi:integrase